MYKVDNFLALYNARCKILDVGGTVTTAYKHFMKTVMEHFGEIEEQTAALKALVEEYEGAKACEWCDGDGCFQCGYTGKASAPEPEAVYPEDDYGVQDDD